MAKVSEVYQRLFQDFSRVERRMGDHPQDGQQAELRTAARAIIRFEHEQELPRLKQLVTEHGSAVAAVGAAKQKLTRLERSIASQRTYIVDRFPTVDTTGDALDLLGWELSAQLGAQAIEQLTARAVETEQELRALVKRKTGLADCLLVQQNEGWDKITQVSIGSGESFRTRQQGRPHKTQAAHDSV